MTRWNWPIALVLPLMVVAFQSDACVVETPWVSPSLSELAGTSEIVAIVHVERVESLDEQDAAFVDRVLDGQLLDTPVILPAPSAHFSTLRVLKGKLPAGSQIRSGATNCEIVLVEGRDYVLFAMQPAAPDDDRIVPMMGTFELGKTEYDMAKLAEVELSLTPSN